MLHRETEPRGREHEPESAPQSTELVESNRAHVARVGGRGRGAGAELEAPEPKPALEPAPEELMVTEREGETVAADATGLGTAAILAGHGNVPDPAGSATPGSATVNGTAGPDARINFTVGSPKETKAPEADIAAAHGRPGVAGWTSAAYDVKVPSVKPDRINVNVTLDFEIELAKEYKGARLEVLRDHEYGHVTIGTNTARTHLATGLEVALERLPGFIPTSPVQAAIVASAASFVRDERAASQAYDIVDYPRMTQAYLGAETPLKDLAAASKEIDKAAKAFRTFAKRGSKVSGARDLRKLVRSMEKTWFSLSNVDLYRVQYNPEFSDIIEDCRKVADELVARMESEELTEPMSGEDAEARRHLDQATDLLEEFEWEPPF